MKNIILLIFMCGLLSACAVATGPIRAESSKGEVFNGEVKVYLTDGVFNLASKSGITCHGTYDRYLTQDPAIPLIVYVSCSDGRHGKAVAKMDLPLGRKTGTGTGTMNDGTRFDFAWGKSRIDEMDQ